MRRFSFALKSFFLFFFCAYRGRRRTAVFWADVVVRFRMKNDTNTRDGRFRVTANTFDDYSADDRNSNAIEFLSCTTVYFWNVPMTRPMSVWFFFFSVTRSPADTPHVVRIPISPLRYGNAVLPIVSFSARPYVRVHVLLRSSCACACVRTGIRHLTVRVGSSAAAHRCSTRSVSCTDRRRRKIVITLIIVARA